MKKVIITKEQEVALEKFKEFGNGMVFFIENRGTWVSNYKSLNNVDPDAFALMYAGVYEVTEDRFKAGDWVFSNTTCKYYKVLPSSEIPKDNTLYDFYVNKEHSRFSKVTDKWKIALLDSGRTSGEFVEGDVIVTPMYSYEVGTNNKFAMEDALSGNIVKFFLKETGVDI